jgi:hypothetical protein
MLNVIVAAKGLEFGIFFYPESGSTLPQTDAVVVSVVN